jgi:hypothetical protein
VIRAFIVHCLRNQPVVELGHSGSLWAMLVNKTSVGRPDNAILFLTSDVANVEFEILRPYFPTRRGVETQAEERGDSRNCSFNPENINIQRAFRREGLNINIRTRIAGYEAIVSHPKTTISSQRAMRNLQFQQIGGFEFSVSHFRDPKAKCSKLVFISLRNSRPCTTVSSKEG